jgi:hypothetical protein
MMKKVMRIGTMDTGGGRRASIYVEAKYEDGRLSVSGVIGPLSSGNALGGCGQIDMEFAHRNPEDDDKRYGELVKPGDITFAPGWSAERWYQLLDVWKEWHLNDMHAGCEHQRALGWEREGYDKHPSEPCPECGYEYGTKWNKVDVPESVIAWIVALPDTDKTPAWV